MLLVPFDMFLRNLHTSENLLVAYTANVKRFKSLTVEDIRSRNKAFLANQSETFSESLAKAKGDFYRNRALSGSCSRRMETLALAWKSW